MTMKNRMKAAMWLFAFPVLAYALPTHRDLPENLVFLSVSEYGKAAFPESVTKDYSRLSDYYALRSELGWNGRDRIGMKVADYLRNIDLEMFFKHRVRSVVLGLTAGSDGLVNGQVILIDGDFDAVEVLSCLAPGAFHTTHMIQSELGTGFLFKNGNHLIYIGSGHDVTWEAPAPHRIRIATRAPLEALRKGQTLDRESVFSDLLIPGDGFKRFRLEPVSLAMISKFYADVYGFETKSKMDAFLRAAVPFHEVVSVEGEYRIVDMLLRDCSMVLHCKSPQAAGAVKDLIQATLDGWKTPSKDFCPSHLPVASLGFLKNIDVALAGDRVRIYMPVTLPGIRKMYLEFLKSKSSFSYWFYQFIETFEY